MHHGTDNLIIMFVGIEVKPREKTKKEYISLLWFVTFLSLFQGLYTPSVLISEQTQLSFIFSLEVYHSIIYPESRGFLYFVPKFIERKIFLC